MSSEVSNTMETLNTGSEIKLKRTMGFWSLVFYGVVFMNPTAVMSFFGQSQIMSKGHSTIVFLIAAASVILTAISYSKMIQAYPNAGSAYAYTSKGISPKLGFVVGWTMLLDYVLTPMFIMTLMGLYLHRIFPAIPFVIWVAVSGLIALTINILGMQISKVLNVATMAIQITIVLTFSILASIYIVKNGTGDYSMAQIFYDGENFELGPTLTVATLAVLSFLGFDGMSTLAEEAKIPPKPTGKAILTAVAIQAICLCGMAFLASCLFPDYTKIANPDTMGYDLYTMAGGSAYNMVIVTLQQFMSFMSMVASTNAASRLMFAMGRAEVLPKRLFGHLSPKFHTPTYGAIFIQVLCLVGAVTIAWNVIAEVVSFGAMFGFACVNLSVINKYFRRDKEIKVFKNLILPGLGFLFISYVLINTSVICKTIGCIWLACGIIYLAIGYNKSKKFKDAINTGLEIEV